MKKSVVLFLLVITVPLFSQIKVVGTITDANGNPPILAHAHIGAYNDTKDSRSYECSKDGKYAIQIPKGGIYSLRISAVDHQEITIPLILNETDKNVTINVQLQANPFNEAPDKITVIGDWNKFAFASTEMMTPQKTADGKTIYTYERTATGDTLSYQLMGIAEGGHSVNGTIADYFMYDGGGDYRSVIRTHKGDKVIITFDPSKVHYTSEKDLPKVDIQNDLFLKNINDFTKIVEKMHRQDTLFYSGGLAKTPSQKNIAIVSLLRQLYQISLASSDSKFSQFVAVSLAKEFNPDFDFGAENANFIMHAVPATSPLWVMAPIEISGITQIGDKVIGEEYKNQLKNNPDRSVRAVVYADEMERAVAAKNITEWRKNYSILKKDYADVPEVKWSIIQNNPDAVVQVGKSVPDFEVALLDGSGKVSNTTMLGKYYMMDFWATWCGPCVREMPAIHQAYEKFKGKKGFEILSFSMDAAEDKIAPFRAKKWKMPWLHTFIPGVFEADLAKKFEVAGIPKPVLVGPDGKIVAMQEDLRGENLEKTLAKFLGETN